MYSVFSELADRPFRMVDPNSPMPLWFQMVSGVESLILSQKLREGEYLPSIRIMARLNGVHPSTVDRSYKILQRMAWIKPDSTRGYVATGPYNEFEYAATFRRLVYPAPWPPSDYPYDSV